MNLDFEPAVIQYLIVIAASLVASTAVGLKRGWRGQLMAFVPILATWALLGSKKEALVPLINVAYRGLLFYSACGSQADTATCVESSGIAEAALINPADAHRSHLLVLLIFVSVVVVVMALVMRFGRRPTSVLQRLVGALLGIANGFTLSYLLLPMLPYRQEIPVPVASTAADEGLPSIAQGLPAVVSVPQVSAAVVLLVVFMVFVILAVRLMRPTEVKNAR